MHRNVARPRRTDLDAIVRVFAAISDAPTMHSFFSEILTPAERSSVALRWKLLRMLHDKVPQRAIARDLRVSLCKITRGSKVLKNPGSVSLRLLSAQGGC